MTLKTSDAETDRWVDSRNSYIPASAFFINFGLYCSSTLGSLYLYITNVYRVLEMSPIYLRLSRISVPPQSEEGSARLQ